MNIKQSGVMIDAEIKQYVSQYNMIQPFVSHRVNSGKLSYGLNSSGYDMRMQNKIMLAQTKPDMILDPCQKRSLNNEMFQTINCNGEFIMPPHSFLLGLTIEQIAMPNDVYVVVVGKSTYARCGIFINVTSIENGAQIGHVVLEIANVSCNPVKIYTGEDSGICKFIFFNTSPCLVPYLGNYNRQDDIIVPGNI